MGENITHSDKMKKTILLILALATSFGFDFSFKTTVTKGANLLNKL